MDIRILPARPAHADVLTGITVAAKRHWNYPERWIQTWLPALTISGEYISANETWIAVVEDVPVAWYSLKQDGGELWLDNLWVNPAHIGKGIGEKLFVHALERSRQRGASVLKIESDPNAEGFYLRMGARRAGGRRGDIESQPRVLPIMEMIL